MSKLKIGVFGAHRGMTMINLLKNNPDAELVAVCDKYVPLLDKCRGLARENGLTLSLCESFEDFIRCDMDAAVLANYATEHAPFAIRLLESGRHVMSEVLTCATLDEAARLCDAVERSGKFYSYAENYCYFNTTYEMRERYRRGDIGELMHAEGEYIHDCSSIWPSITYGEREHWRNRTYSTFYCTHSLGPVLFSTGLRPVRVTGMESPCAEFMAKLGGTAGSHGIELVQLENGATVKSIHGGLKREPGSINYELYGTRGSMETDRHDSSKLWVYREGDRLCHGGTECYAPEFTLPGSENSGHGGSDFFTLHWFIRSCLGDAEAKKNCVDVYAAVHMCIPGILAYRSILRGGEPQEVPDLRTAAGRDACRGDTFCTIRSIAGDMWAPNCPGGEPEVAESVYEYVRGLWLAGKDAE